MCGCYIVQIMHQISLLNLVKQRALFYNIYTVTPHKITIQIVLNFEF